MPNHSLLDDSDIAKVQPPKKRPAIIFSLLSPVLIGVPIAITTQYSPKTFSVAFHLPSENWAYIIVFGPMITGIICLITAIVLWIRFAWQRAKYQNAIRGFND